MSVASSAFAGPSGHRLTRLMSASDKIGHHHLIRVASAETIIQCVSRIGEASRSHSATSVILNAPDWSPLAALSIIIPARPPIAVAAMRLSPDPPRLMFENILAIQRLGLIV